MNCRITRGLGGLPGARLVLASAATALAAEGSMPRSMPTTGTALLAPHR